MTTFSEWNDMPMPVQEHLNVLQDFIGDVDGHMMCTAADENTVIDDGTIDAEDAVKAINGLVDWLRAALLDASRRIG